MSEALNITKAAFGGLREVTTAPLWQWDYGQILQITGLDLPQAFEVHFSNSRKSGETITQIGTDGEVTIPDMYLTSGADIYCFIFLHDGLTDGETEYVIKIPVRERPEPSDLEPTPEQQDAITEAIAALNDAVEQTGEDKAATAALAEAAAASSLVATEAAQSAQGSATSASGSATTATNAAATATQKASEATTSAASAASAKTSAETAQSNAQAAQTASESAQASAESAAQTATSKASEASTSATSASGSASAASSSASAASESATNAAASATSASGSATAAAGSATTASTKASEASASATAAQTAQTAAEAAQTAAETAAATFETDTTLSIAGKAADAKATGDEISDLKSAIVRFKGDALSTGYDFNTLLTNGIWTVRASRVSACTNNPTGTSGELKIVVQEMNTNVSWQRVFDSTGGEWHRTINSSTGVPITDWVLHISQTTGTNTTIPMSQKAVTDALATKVNDSDSVIRRNTLAHDTDLNTVTDNGWYSFSTGVRQTLLNLPADVVSGTGTLICIKGTDSGSNVTTQLLLNNISGRCKVFERVLNNKTHVPLSGHDWRTLTTELVSTTGQSTTSVMTQKAVTDAIDAIGVQSSSVWKGKTLAFFGDSRTWYDGHEYGERTKPEWEGKTCVGYQQTIANLLGCSVISQGVSGNTSAQICERIRAYDFTGVDAVFLEGGVNDFVKSSTVTIGEIASIGSTFDTSTVYGAWQSAVEYILTNYPSVLIYMDIPAIAWTSAGLFPYNIAKIKGEIAELYHLPCLDLYKNAGINEVNRDYWYCDDVTETNWRLHFNDYGNALVGAKIAEFMIAN